MLSVGDKIVYPMHGAGVVTDIEEKEILGVRTVYYVLEFSHGGMHVMVPVDNQLEVGLRQIIPPAECTAVLRFLTRAKRVSDENWNHRYRVNLERLRSGEAYAVADVVRSLYILDCDKGLSAGEKKMFTSAVALLAGELELSAGLGEEQIYAALEKARPADADA